MNTIGKLIELALQQCCERGVIDWYPGETDAPETFYAECDIYLNRYWVGPDEGGYWNGDYHVFLGDVFCIIDVEWLECWHSSKCEVLA